MYSGGPVIYRRRMAPQWCMAAAIVLAACGDSPSTTDAQPDTVPNDGRIHVDDGTPTRQACTSAFGSGLTASPAFGRLDGYLVSIVLPGASGCNADSSHVHLQVRMKGAIYDVAIDVTNDVSGVDDVHTTARDQAMPIAALPWAEGWHTGIGVDYVALGVHSTDLALATKSQMTTTLMNDLATANHISIYATTYGADGAHLVHRNGSGRDGLIVTEPLSVPAHLRLLSFAGQTF